MDNLSKTPPSFPFKEKNKDKGNTEKDQNTSKFKSPVNYGVFAFLGAFLIVVLIFLLFIKRKK